MQYIVHSYDNHSNLFDEIESAYTELSDYDTNIHILSEVFKPLVKMFKEYVLIKEPQFDEYIFKPLNESELKQGIYTVCISGGKDSVAVTKYLVDRGYNVMLYHMQGINPAYYDEHTVIPEISKRFKILYHIDNVRLIGKHQYVEHPMKNMLIANGAINYCLEQGIYPNIVFGNYSESNVDGMEFDIDAGDSRDMWNLYEAIIQNILPSFKVYTPLKNISDTYRILDDINLIKECISCMGPYRFRKHWKKRTEDKYDISLMPNRCGGCAKCAFEYMVLTDRGDLEYNRDYYNHCMDILIKNTKTEVGIKNPTFDEVWNRFFWYDISESHIPQI